MKIIRISKILQDKQITAVITTPITRYSPLFKSDSVLETESTGENKHISKTVINNESKINGVYTLSQKELSLHKTILLTICCEAVQSIPYFQSPTNPLYETL